MNPLVVRVISTTWLSWVREPGVPRTASSITRCIAEIEVATFAFDTRRTNQFEFGASARTMGPDGCDTGSIVCCAYGSNVGASRNFRRGGIASRRTWPGSCMRMRSAGVSGVSSMRANVIQLRVWVSFGRSFDGSDCMEAQMTKLDQLAIRLIEAVRKAGIGRYQMRFYTGGLVNVDTGARAAKRPKPKRVADKSAP